MGAAGAAGAEDVEGALSLLTATGAPLTSPCSARAGQTSRKSVATVLATLNRLRANVVGLVLNQVHKELSDSYYYYGYYRGYNQPAEAEKAKHQEAGA